MKKSPFKRGGQLNPAVIYEGPSMIDGAPIVAIATPASTNTKTGGMLQVWILSARIDPITANRTGADFSICGDCPLKGRANNKPSGYATGRGCYVNLVHGPLGIFKKYTRGGYAYIKDGAELIRYGRGQNIRLGAYGDPAALPRHIVDDVLAEAEGWTGYSHQLNRPEMRGAKRRAFSMFCMASADSLEQARQFWAEGFRTFRTIASPADIVPGEIICPATAEGGRRTTCEACGLCKGSGIKAKNIAAVVHGSQKRNAAEAIRGASV
jgi:hypothetical protein